MTRSGAEIRREKEKKAYKLGDLKLSEHPVQYHRSHGDKMHDFITLTVTHAGEKGAPVKVDSTCINLGTPTDDLGDQAIGVIEIIGRILHWCRTDTWQQPCDRYSDSGRTVQHRF